MYARLSLLCVLLSIVACADTQAPEPKPDPQLRDAILFLSDRNGGRQMHFIKLTGEAVEPIFPDTNLLGGGTIAGRSAISPDGRWIAFSMLGDIWIARADGSEPRNLTAHPADDVYPAWSPDGTRLAFESDRDGDDDIYVIDVDGTDLVQVTNDPGRDAVPAWSPIGDQLAFESDRSGTADIYVVSSVGGVALQLTSGPDWDGEPAWSSDGTTIAFDRSNDIYLMDATGGNVRPLVVLTDTAAYFPAWSPGDTLIAFTDGNRIWLIRPDGSGRVHLTNDPTSFEDTPAWAP